MGICEDCEPEKFKEQYEKDLVYMQKRNMGQEHITEHTFFPKKAPSRQYQMFKWYRRQQKWYSGVGVVVLGDGGLNMFVKSAGKITWEWFIN